MRRFLPFLLALGSAGGCRTAGPQVCIRGSHDVTVTVTSETRASMGKSVSGEISPEVSAGVTAQANGNAASQSGTATASPSGNNDASADASVGAVPSVPTESTKTTTATE